MSARPRLPRGTSVADRLAHWSDREGHCLVWQGQLNNCGYGQMTIAGKTRTVHRVAYELNAGWPIAPGLHVNHLCGNRACIEPTHLSLATPAQNARYLTTLNVKNTSGYRGVSLHKFSGKWEAHLTIGGKKRHIGLYETPEEANEAAVAARAEHHGVPEFADVMALLSEGTVTFSDPQAWASSPGESAPEAS